MCPCRLGQKLLKGGNYSREDTTCENTIRAILSVKVQVNKECSYKNCFIALCGGSSQPDAVTLLFYGVAYYYP